MDKEAIAKIRDLLDEGKTQAEVSRILNLSKSLVNYYSSEETRKKIIQRAKKYFKKLPKEKKRERARNHRDYLRNYFNNRYNTDEEFRKKHIERVIEYQKKKYERRNK